MTQNNTLFGLHAVTAFLKNQPDQAIRAFILKEKQDPKIKTVIDLLNQHHISIEYTSRKVLDEATDEGKHQGVVLFCRAEKNYSEADLENILQNLHEPPLLLILDGIQDPHNLGACLRSAESLGAHAVIAPKDKSVGLTGTVLKVASGARIPFISVTNLARLLRFLKEKNIWIYGGDSSAETNLYAADFKGGIAIVMGAEGAGLRRLTREHCDVLLRIPMQGSVSSLNVSVATGIFLYEVLRQRLRTGTE